MATLQDYFKGINTGYKPWTLPQIPQTPLFTTTTQTLPNAGGTYQSVAPVTPQPIIPKPATIPTKPIVPTAPVATQLDYSRYTDPTTGRVMSPQEYAASLATRVSSQRTAGDVPTYAGNVLTQGPQTSGQLQMTAAQLNNARNDIATGTTDPYAVGNRSGVAYSPAELAAIEKAYAGIYDPAINSALARLDAKQKEDTAAIESKQKLEQMAQQHAYDVALKKTPTATEASFAAGGGTGEYVEGANPTVDAWVDRISRNQGTLSEITGVKNQSLRDAVVKGLNTLKARNATSAGTLNDVNTINTMLANPKLENISGLMGQLTGGIFGQAKTAKVQYNQILGALQLAKAGSVKGQGQISDYERTILKEAAAAVDRGMSDDEFRKALVKLRGVLQTSSGMEALVKITDPTTKEEDIQSLNTEEINKFIRDGAIVEYVE